LKREGVLAAKLGVGEIGNLDLNSRDEGIQRDLI